MLDYETKPRHTVTLTANDGSGASNSAATISVTIYVIDADEAPTIMDRADSTAKGEQTVEYAENGTGAVATFTARDPEGVSPIAWSLTDADVTDVVAGDDIADRAAFKVDQNGVLAFLAPPSFEGQSVSADDNYQVVVQASDGNVIGYFKVTVSVTDVEETGTVAWTVDADGSSGGNAAVAGLRQFRPGADLAATVTDPDIDTVSNPSWQWYRSSSKSSTGTAIATETNASYTVTDDDVNRYIHVVATYSDGSVRPETASLASERKVQAARDADNTEPAFASPTVTREFRRTVRAPSSEGRSRPRTPMATC